MKAENLNSGRQILFPTLLAVATIVLNYEYVEAQILSLANQDKIEKLDSYNSQTMPLLKPGVQVTIDPLTLESGVFLAETGPLGVSYDTTPGGVISAYEVQSGDTIEGIAQTFGISKNTIIWANDLKRGESLRVGQRLVILPISGVRYVVKQDGESVEKIAKQFDGDANEIIFYNDISGVVLKKGMEIIIPDGELASVSEKKTESKEETKQSPKQTGPKLATRVSVSRLYDPTGYFDLPIKSGIRTQKLHGFNGVDIGAPIGTPVYAAKDGVVITAKGGNRWWGGYGNYVVISHDNGTQTLYAHLDSVSVLSGETVKKGEKIGESGNTGRSTGPHLHFEIRGGKNFMNQ